ncbi:PREDICTED: probable thionin-2.4 [Camelina sativa]|uniref:Probable thionin-2.4 n=1 Tax=Camelina sativa TaxID=90675 RepID=A0ABM1Q8N3_CAMSA|nr:PREDICTED: probable thionin-2.4 [Camelina sativa]
MEGKTLILSVLVLSLFMAQIQVDAKSCCPTTTARNLYNVCRITGSPRERCASLSGCKIVSGSCPNGYNKDIIFSRTQVNDVVSEYCNVGCVSSVCGALTTLQNSVASEIVNGAVNKCVSACSTVCTKNSMNAVETA